MQEDCFERPPVVFTGNEAPQASEVTLTLNDGSNAVLRLRGETRDLIQAKGQTGEIIGSWCTFIHEVDTCSVERGTIDGSRWILSHFEHPLEGERVYNWNLGCSFSLRSAWTELLPEGESQVVAMRYYHAEDKEGWIELVLKDGSFYKLYPKPVSKVTTGSTVIDTREPIRVGRMETTLGLVLNLVRGAFQA